MSYTNFFGNLVKECLTGGFLHAVSHKSSVPYQVEQQAVPRTEVIVWDRLGSPSVNILLMTKLLSLDPLPWDMDCLLTLWPLLIPRSLGNGCCPFGFLTFIILERNFLYNSLYILTERSAPSELRSPCLFCFSLSLRLILSSVETRHAHSPAWASKTPSRRRSVPSSPREGSLCLCEWCKPCVKGFIGSLHKPGNINLFLSFTFLLSTPDRQVPVY